MAYELDGLVAELKKNGLDLAEDAARVAAESVLDWLSSSAVASENKVDDVLVALVPVVKPYVMDMIDKIDGEDDDA